MKNSVKLAVLAITWLVLAACVIISTVARDSAASRQDPVSLSVSNEDKRYIVGERQGRLVVWREGESEPFMTTDTFTYTLPRADRNKLGEGILIKGDRELRRTLEDYCS